MTIMTTGRAKERGGSFLLKMAHLLRLLLGAVAACTVAHAASTPSPSAAAAAQCPSAALDYASSVATVEKAWALTAFAEFVPVLREQRIDGLTLGSVSAEGLAMATKLPLGVAVHLKLCFEHALERGEKAGHADGESAGRAAEPKAQPPVLTDRRHR